MSNFDEKYYGQMSDQQVFDKIREIKSDLGEDLVVLAHHYQSDETFRFADITGDSLKLSDQAAHAKDAKYIVFCGVYFMAEVARMLCSPEQKVILPDHRAGCDLAEDATIEQLEHCWSKLSSTYPGERIVPVVYINSTAQIKAFCGRHGGVVCTSGNAQSVISWALSEGDIVLFAPDQHLGWNASVAMGIEVERILRYQPGKPQVSESTDGNAPRMVLWPGNCSVHMLFTVEDVERVRQEYPGVKVIVHPECRAEVVDAADAAGSTSFIISRIEQAEDGSVWAVGTEKDMVDRLARNMGNRKKVVNLSTLNAYCPTMKYATGRKLLWVLENLRRGKVVNEVQVDKAVCDQASDAIRRMLELRSARPKAVKDRL